MTYEHSDIVTIINADDIFLAQSNLLGEGPMQAEDRIDYCKIEDTAKSALPEGAHKPQITLIDYERDSSHPLYLFHHWAQARGYPLHLISLFPFDSDRSRYDARLIDRLQELEQDDASHVVYVCGGCRSDAIRAALLKLAEQRDVSLLHFERKSSFTAGDLAKFCKVWDFVEIGAASARHYRNLPQRQPGETAVAEQSKLVSGAAVDAGDRQGTSRRASLQRSPLLLSKPEPAPQPRLQPQSERQHRPQSQPRHSSAEPLDDVFDRSVPLVVLIDSENVDSTLYELLNPTGNEGVELDRDKRWDWNKLRHWISNQIGEDRALVVPVLSFPSGEKEQRHKLGGFLRFLRQMPGFQPQAFVREDGRSVVDEAINKLLLTLSQWPANVLLISHDGDFFRLLEKLRSTEGAPNRRIAVAGFPERMNSIYHSVDWLRLLDIEHDMKLFSYRLPNRGVNKPKSRASNSIDDFDADALLAGSGLFPRLEPDVA